MVHFSLLLIIALTNKIAYNKEKTNWLLSNLSLGEHKNEPSKGHITLLSPSLSISVIIYLKI